MEKPGFNLKKILYIFLGMFFLVLAYFGILLPGVPAIPFIVFAAFFFANSSEKLHQWMLNQKLIGRIMRKLDTKQGRLGSKLFIISQLWVSVIVAEIIFVTTIFYGMMVIVGGIIFSIILFKLLERK